MEEASFQAELGGSRPMPVLVARPFPQSPVRVSPRASRQGPAQAPKERLKQLERRGKEGWLVAVRLLVSA